MFMSTAFYKTVVYVPGPLIEGLEIAIVWKELAK